jgi:endonuclease/exonuclease/phosphatase family metal-dependent hydrolase
VTKALKVMTWNVQQLPDPVGPGDAESRATQVARVILDMHAREQPDVVAFNEVFNEDGRKRLLRMLKPVYPHFVKKLEHPTIDVEEDSGLMLFSKLPFLPLPTGSQVFFEAFPQAVGTDALSAKGVGVVRVAGPGDPTTIAFSHTQSSADDVNSQHALVRAEQFAFIRDVLRRLSEGNQQTYANSVLMGDLNVKGDPDDTTGEYNKIFSGAPNTFGGDFDDSWRVSMHPPRDLNDYDPGYTQRDTPTLIPNRLDYVCAKFHANIDIGLIAHHMAVPFRLPSGVTDHFALTAHLHRLSPNCSPALAFELLKAAPKNPGASGSRVWSLPVNLRDEDMFHWVYIDSAATFSVWLPPTLEVAAYRRSDFTTALLPIDTLSVSELPPNLQTDLGALGKHRLPMPNGIVFSSREPFFLRIRGTLPSFSGVTTFEVMQHKGESRATAFVLHPHLPLDPELPAGQRLGVTDQCFFLADRPDRFSETPYADQFVLDNPAGAGVTLDLDDGVRIIPGGVKGSLTELVLERAERRERIFIVLTRASVADVLFSMTWRSSLTFVALDESFRLHVDDETGPDWPGEDEFELSVNIDGANVYFDSWDDADTDEDWPDLVGSIRTSVQNKKGQPVTWVAFSSEIAFELTKTDGLSAHGSQVGVIEALKPRDRESESRIAVIPVPDIESDGQLTAHAQLSKFPRT